MKWFKHQCNASDNLALNNLIDEFGLKGYAWWFLLLELCAEKFDGISEPEFRFHIRTVKLKLRASGANVSSFLRRCDAAALLSCTVVESPCTGVESEFHLKIPKLLEIKDNHTRNLQATDKKVSARLDIDKNRLDKIKNISPKADLTPPKEPSPVSEIRESFLQNYRKEFQREYAGWGAKENGMVSKWLKSVSLENAKRLCELYPKWNDPWVTKQGHPLGILMAQYVQLDAWAQSTPQLIKKIAAGKAAENVDLKRAVDFEEMKRGLKHSATRQQTIENPSPIGRLQKSIPLPTAQRILGERGDPFGAEIFDPPSESDFGESL